MNPISRASWTMAIQHVQLCEFWKMAKLAIGEEEAVKRGLNPESWVPPRFVSYPNIPITRGVG